MVNSLKVVEKAKELCFITAGNDMKETGRQTSAMVKALKYSATVVLTKASTIKTRCKGKVNTCGRGDRFMKGSGPTT